MKMSGRISYGSYRMLGMRSVSKLNLRASDGGAPISINHNSLYLTHGNDWARSYLSRRHAHGVDGSVACEKELRTGRLRRMSTAYSESCH